MRIIILFVLIGVIYSCNPPCGYDVNSKIPYILKGDYEVVSCISDGWGGYEMLIRLDKAKSRHILSELEDIGFQQYERRIRANITSEDPLIKDEFIKNDLHSDSISYTRIDPLTNVVVHVTPKYCYILRPSGVFD